MTSPSGSCQSKAWKKEEDWILKLPPAWMETPYTVEQSSAEQSSARGSKGSNHLFASITSEGTPSGTRWSRNGLWYTVGNNVIVLGSWFLFEGTQPGLHSHQIGAGELIDYTVNQLKLTKKKIRTALMTGYKLIIAVMCICTVVSNKVYPGVPLETYYYYYSGIGDVCKIIFSRYYIRFASHGIDEKFIEYYKWLYKVSFSKNMKQTAWTNVEKIKFRSCG